MCYLPSGISLIIGELTQSVEPSNGRIILCSIRYFNTFSILGCKDRPTFLAGCWTWSHRVIWCSKSLKYQYHQSIWETYSVVVLYSWLVCSLKDLFLVEYSWDDSAYHMMMYPYCLCPCTHPLASSHLQYHILVHLVILKENLNEHSHAHYLYLLVLVALVLLWVLGMLLP